MKKCSKCNIDKDLEKFSKNKQCVGGLHTICKDCIKEYNKKYYKSNATKIKYTSSIYRENNKEVIKTYKKLYQQENKDKINLYKRKWSKHKLKTDPLYKLQRTLRRRVSLSLKSGGYSSVKGKSKLLGCTLQQARLHIEKLFAEGMSWANHGEWHIDHIIPLSSAKTKEEVVDLCHYTNLQPLWALDNLKKSNKIL